MSKPRDTKPTQELELRVVNLEKCEVRASADGSTKFTGYAAVFDSLSVDLGGFRERIRAGAFRNAIEAKQDVRLLINHDSNLILGRTISGTVTLREDETGLYVEADLPDTSYARDLTVSMRRGDISQMSFGFITRADEWNEKDPETGLPIRELVAADLFDVSPVTYPAYPATTAEVRSAAAAAATSLNIEPAPVVELRASEALAGVIESLTAATEALSALASEERDESDEAETAETPEGETADEDEDETPEGEQPEGDDSERSADEAELRVGKTISTKNRDTISSAIQGLSGAAEALQTLLDENDGVTSNSRPDFGSYRDTVAAAHPDLEEREWDYGDDYEVYLLTSMIACGSTFMEYEDDDADTAVMATQLQNLSALLATELAEASAVRFDEARPNLAAFLRVEEREWKWDDDFQVYLLTQMIALGSSFMSNEGDDEHVSVMSDIVQALAALLAAEIGEAIEPEDEPEPVETNSLRSIKRLRLDLLEREVL
jgi:HK97 family phage prohead protease